jgi:hypothetical protein
MTLMSGKAGTITPRDQDILETLFFCRYLSTKEIAALFFTSTGRARARLPELEEKGYVQGRTMYVRDPSWDDRAARETVWHLKKAGFDSVVETLDLEEAYVPKQLLPKQARHYVLTNEVYVAAKADLDAELGPYPGWEWRHEKRVHYSGEYENVPYAHKPDAHVLFRGHTFIIERQTAASKVGPKAIEKKVIDHKRYVELRLETPAEVLFACDDPVVAQAAERIGDRHGLRVTGGDVGRIANYLYTSAVRLS